MTSLWLTGFEIITGLASIFGLLFSYLAWEKARLALEAAREARNAVRKSNAGEELRELNGKAKALLRSAQKDERDAALLTSADLLSGMGQACNRWRRFFGEVGASRIKAGAKKVEKISVALSVGGAALTAEEREKVLEFCHDVVALLAEESGKMLERLEEEGADA